LGVRRRRGPPVGCEDEPLTGRCAETRGPELATRPCSGSIGTPAWDNTRDDQPRLADCPHPQADFFPQPPGRRRSPLSPPPPPQKGRRSVAPVGGGDGARGGNGQTPEKDGRQKLERRPAPEGARAEWERRKACADPQHHPDKATVRVRVAATESGQTKGGKRALLVALEWGNASSELVCWDVAGRYSYWLGTLFTGGLLCRTAPLHRRCIRYALH